MRGVPKNFYSGPLTLSPANVYTAPTNKYAIVKSLTLCNNSTTDATFTISVNGTYVAFNHTLKSRDTLILKDLNIPIMPGGLIQVYGTGQVSYLNLHISGEERDYSIKDYPFVRANGFISATSSALLNADNVCDQVLKSLIIVNPKLIDYSITLSFGSVFLLSEHVIKSYDTLIVPLPNMVLEKGKTMNAYVNTGTNSLWFGITTEKVGM